MNEKVTFLFIIKKKHFRECCSGLQRKCMHILIDLIIMKKTRIVHRKFVQYL